MKSLKYLRYLIKHKWYTFQECRKRGIWWAGLTHDLSKFRPSEWGPYLEKFYGDPNCCIYVAMGEMSTLDVLGLEASGHKFQEQVDYEFDEAWLHHIHRNPHHWQYWLLQEDDGDLKVLEMPMRYRKEMVADWIGAGKATGHPDTPAWYEKNKDKIKLAILTRYWVEVELGIIPAVPHG